jgi:hypothetical protein
MRAGRIIPAGLRKTAAGFITVSFPSDDDAEREVNVSYTSRHGDLMVVNAQDATTGETLDLSMDELNRLSDVIERELQQQALDARAEAHMERQMERQIPWGAP